MGHELYQRFPVFAEAFDTVCARLDPHLDIPLRDLLFRRPPAADGPRGRGPVDRTGYAQAGIFAVQVAMYRLLEQFGVTPDFLAGHSIGELTAAHLAGVWSLEDAAELVAARGRLMQALPERGAMLAVQASAEEIQSSLTGHENRVALAAENGPSSVVISGDTETVLDIGETWAQRGRRTSRLRVSHAFHSPHMDAMLDDFTAVAKGLAYHPPRIPLVANLTGATASPELICAPEYWVTQIRQPVRFAAGVGYLRERGVGTYVEVGPDSVLAPLIVECLAGDSPAGAPADVISVCRRDQTEPAALLTALSRFHVRGGHVDWTAQLDRHSTSLVDLPTYAFQRKVYWLDEVVRAATAGTTARLAKQVPGGPSSGDDTADEPDGAKLAAIPPEDRYPALLAILRKLVAEVIGDDSSVELSADTPLLELGFTSLMAVDLRNKAVAAVGVDIPATVIYDYPTLGAAARYLDSLLVP